MTTKPHKPEYPSMDGVRPIAPPKLLAPAGGMAQFFAAIHAGADSVFLGLKRFNARGRADNFSLEELREAAAYAETTGTDVLLTLNILLKEDELPDLRRLLRSLTTIPISALIIQDLGLLHLVKTEFPGLAVHASTQMALHNKDGVLAAANLGIKRAVLARELTFQELRLIRDEADTHGIELEAFCHGSLCYSYSGLCFFSGIEDARSGNRGECAYTCRKPYKILNEPGHGFLFSMKDLATYDSLDRFLDAGIHTLKIEGRKKDAQYVATTVALYRQRLNQAWEKKEGDFANHAVTKSRSLDQNALLASQNSTLERDLSYGFQRGETSFFLKGRYHENVIDLNNPSHLGRLLGTIESMKESWALVKLLEDITLHDGLRIVPFDSLVHHSSPQHGMTVTNAVDSSLKKYHGSETDFPLLELKDKDGRKIYAASSGSLAWLRITIPSAQVGDKIHKIRSNQLKEKAQQISKPASSEKLRPWQCLKLHIEVKTTQDEASFALTFSNLLRQSIVTLHGDCSLSPKEPSANFALREDLENLFSVIGDLDIQCEVSVAGDLDRMILRSQLKVLKRALVPQLDAALKAWFDEPCAVVASTVVAKNPSTSSLAIKIDNLDYLPWIASYCEANPTFSLSELTFECKRHSLHLGAGQTALQNLQSWTRANGVKFRLSLPTVMRAWDTTYVSQMIKWFVALDESSFEIGNLGSLELLRRVTGREQKDLDVSSDFTLYALNSLASKKIADLGIQKITLSVEDDVNNIKNHLQNWQAQAVPEMILFKDTPLFIAESCSLTALHNGCPGPKVCGYRTLVIEDEQKQIYHVAHESCRTIVYGDKPFAVSHFRSDLEEIGFRNFRMDFLTKPYTKEEIHAVIEAVEKGLVIPNSHLGNFSTSLL